MRFNLPTKSDPELIKLVGPYATQSLVDAPAAISVLTSVERAGYRVRLNPDAEEWLDRQLAQAHLRAITEEIRRGPANHPLRTQLLQTELLPYQLDGIAFCVGAGRAVLADDMGLGKTIQGIGIAELLAQQIGIQKVLIVCPATLKSQWISEIHRFCGRTCQIVTGRPDQRATQYQADTFFTVCNYEQVVRDLTTIQQAIWDLVLLDEGQRIKNWESLTSRAIRSLRSRFATVLTGTPVENRLDDLFTILQFVDEQRLGPAYQFFHRHRVVDENGRVKGYHRLDQLRTVLEPVVLRRTREQVLSQLPERIDQTVRIVPTDEQLEIHNGHMQTVRQITRKPYLTEMDILRLQKALLMSRMAANSTFLVNKTEPEYSSKLDHLRVLLESLLAEPQRKLAVFSEWRTMLDRIEQILAPWHVSYVRLDGKVPQAQRTTIVQQFQKDEQCRLILLTNAGSTGLNLQSADTVINVDLPWNPAILEQRIGRAYRMGQKRRVQVYKLVTVDTIEERLLTALASKTELAQAALDGGSDIESVASYGGIEELKRRLEVLLGQTPPAPLDASQKRDVGQVLGKPADVSTGLLEAPTGLSSGHRERVAEAGGQLLGAALQLVGELIQTPDRAPIAPQLVDQMTERLAQCVERDELNRPQLRISLPDDDSLRNLAATLARLLVTK